MKGESLATPKRGTHKFGKPLSIEVGSDEEEDYDSESPAVSLDKTLGNELSDFGVEDSFTSQEFSPIKPV
jgi:hypothetical protein